MSSTPDGAPSADVGKHQHHDPPPAAAAAAAANAADPAATAERELTDEELAERHRAWMAEHGRVYGDEAERERRLGIFRDNLRFIEAHNRGGHSYTLGLNQFADLTNEEFRATYCGGLRQSDREAPPLGDDLNGDEREEEERRGVGGPALGSPPPEARTGRSGHF